jgi:hypothetical protein
MARRLRRDHRHVDVFRWDDEPEADAEAVAEHQHLALGQMLMDVRLVDLLLLLIRDQDHDDVAPRGCFRDGHHAQAGVLRLLHGLARRRQADDDVHAAVLQVQRVRVPLCSVADDPDLLAANQFELCILVVVHRRHYMLLVWAGLKTGPYICG